tara:strand:+ start:1813 stop:2982 length:1170 start_codon:yes stop_codon:yes gene_type:complete
VEAIFWIIVIVLGWWGLNSIGGASGGETDSKVMGPFEVRLVDEEIGEESKLKVKAVEIRGAFPISGSVNLCAMTSVVTGQPDEFKPVFSFFDDWQEPNSTCYQVTNTLGRVNGDQGLTEWFKVGVVVPAFLHPAESGQQTITVILRLYDEKNPPEILGGLGEAGLHLASVTFNHVFTEKGYEEIDQDQEEANGLAIRIGVAVAMADGELHDKEGYVIQEWIKRQIAGHSGEVLKNLKDNYNQAMKDAFADEKAKELSLSDATRRLNEIGEQKSKYDAITLCYDVMAADGTADKEEMATISKIAEALGLDYDELKKIKDRAITDVKVEADEQSIEELLHIDPNWDDEKKKQHLVKEYATWNSRHTNAKESEKRYYENILNRIAELRKKYE